MKKIEKKRERTYWIGIAVLSIALIIFLVFWFFATDMIGSFCEKHLGVCHPSVTDTGSLFFLLRLKGHDWLRYVMLSIPVISFSIALINIICYNKRKKKYEKC